MLHHGDLTYSLVNAMEGYTRKEAYVYLCQFLIEAWAKLGRSLQFGAAVRGYHHETNCFRLATGADLVDSGGQKFVGSAQLWRGSTVLQHGSMRLDPNAALQTLVFGPDAGVSPLSMPPTTGINSFDLIIQHLKQAAMDTFQIQLNTVPITDSEWDEIQSFLPGTQVHRNNQPS